MRKLFLFTALISVLLPLVAPSQNDSNLVVQSKQKAVFKNQFDINVYVYGLGVTYTSRIIKNISCGIELSGGYMFSGSYHNFTKVYFTTIDGEEKLMTRKNLLFLEVAKVNLYLDFSLTKNWHINTGVKYAYVKGITELGGDIDGITLGIFYKTFKFSLGIEQSLVNYNENQQDESPRFLVHDDNTKLLIATTFLILKLPLKKW